MRAVVILCQVLALHIETLELFVLVAERAVKVVKMVRLVKLAVLLLLKNNRVMI